MLFTYSSLTTADPADPGALVFYKTVAGIKGLLPRRIWLPLEIV